MDPKSVGACFEKLPAGRHGFSIQTGAAAVHLIAALSRP